MLRVGLTGGIATGKSHVLRRMAAAGCATLDLDRAARAAVAPGGAAWEEVSRAFPDAVLPDGTIDRKRLGSIVFGDSAARERLNAIVHPRVRDAEVVWATERSAPGAVLVTDAALLVETGMHLRFDRLVVVSCPPEMQRLRLMARDGLAEDDALARLRAQLPAEEKRAFGHHVIDTSGRPEETDAQADALVDVLRREARSRPTPMRPPRSVAQRWLDGPGLALLRALQRHGSLDLAWLARERGCTSPWYRCGEPTTAPVAGLAAAVAVWGLARRGADEAWTVSAVASLGRLVLATTPERAWACRHALAALADLAGEPGGRSEAERWDRLARRWAGADVMPSHPLAKRPAEAAVADPGDWSGLDDLFA